MFTKKKFVFSFLLFLYLFIIFSFIFFYPGITDFFQKVVARIGLYGLIVLTFIFDSIPVLVLSPDIPLFFVIQGKANAFNAGLITGVVSGIAGFIGYLIGTRLIRKDTVFKWVKDYFDDKLEKARRTVIEYGIVAVILAALTPVPFSIVCWVAGMTRMRLLPFLATVFLSRTIRFMLMAHGGLSLHDLLLSGGVITRFLYLTGLLALLLCLWFGVRIHLKKKGII